MKGKTYRIRLTAAEEQQLTDIVSGEGHPERQLRRARILLLLNEGTGREGNPAKVPKQGEIAERCRCHADLIYTVGKQYAEGGLERVLNRKKRETPPVPAKVTGEMEAKIIALSRSEPPEGHGRWTLRLLEERSKAELGIGLSDTTIRSVLKRNSLLPESV
jgi:transposase